jgi:hypothetical protein
MHFKIVGARAGRRFSETRALPASAAVLALKWIAQGVEHVKIIQADGSTHPISEFQKRFLGDPRSKGEDEKLHGAIAGEAPSEEQSDFGVDRHCKPRLPDSLL